MYIDEIVAVLQKAVPRLNFSSKTISTSGSMRISIEGLYFLNKALDEISVLNLNVLNNTIIEIRNLLFTNPDIDEKVVSQETYKKFTDYLSELRLYAAALIGYGLDIRETDPHTIKIKLPPISNFDDLEKISRDLKKAIEIPINDSSSNEPLQIKSAEPGSIFLTVFLGSIASFHLVARIVRAAINIKMENARANAAVEYTKTIKLQNEILETYVKGVKETLKKVTEQEAQQIAEDYYSDKSHEAIKRLQHSIEVTKELIDKGALIFPANSSEANSKIFPDFSELLLNLTKTIDN